MLLTLASAPVFLMRSTTVVIDALTVAQDVGTSVTGIQTAITFYTLVMAALMITGGKLGQTMGRRRAFMLGCVVYGWARSPPRSPRACRC
ncbi:hypothetical protein [Georgenia sp. SUBG003]|uniref:hypothetical protein n=1 Tax=Georgenia sp. SUBG003 TaxID=1497974 RepID=UPI003AB69428